MALALLTLPLAAGPRATPWPAGVVTYRFDPSVTAGDRAAFVQALELWDPSGLGLKFEERTPEPWSGLAWALGLDRAVVVRVDRSLRALGRTTLGAGPRRELVFNPDRTPPEWLVADLAHEWGHVLGLTHEHQRWDRDRYVAFPPGFLEGLPADRLVDYALDPDDPPPGAGRPYDFDSLMQYSSNVDGNRMVRRDTGALVPGARVPSSGDRARLALLYPHRPQEGP